MLDSLTVFSLQKETKNFKLITTKESFKITLLAAVQLASEQQQDTGNWPPMSTAERKKNIDLVAVKPRCDHASSSFLE